MLSTQNMYNVIEHKQCKKKCPDFEFGTKIYVLFDKKDGYFFIGATSGSTSSALSSRKKEAKKDNISKVNEHFNRIGWENVKFQLIVRIQESLTFQQQLNLHRQYIYKYKDDAKLLNTTISDNFDISKYPIANIDIDKFIEYQNKHKKREFLKILNNDTKKSEICPCGGSFVQNEKNRHCHTNRHKKYFNII